MRNKWSDKDTQTLKRDFPVKSAGKIAKALGRSTGAVYTKAWQLGLDKPDTAINWTRFMLNFLKSQYNSLTNKQLADALGLRLTVTRNKLRELGLKRMELEYWNDEMIQYLKDNYKTTGDVEIMEEFIRKWPKVKGWRRFAIAQKRKYLGLERTPAEVASIVEKHHQAGGRMCTIINNSSSLNLHPLWVAQQIAWRDREMQQELMKRPEIIDTARDLIKLKRTIKSKKQNHE